MSLGWPLGSSPWWASGGSVTRRNNCDGSETYIGTTAATIETDPIPRKREPKVFFNVEPWRIGNGYYVGYYNLDKASARVSMGQLSREVVMATREELAEGTALAGGAIAAALLEHLFDKELISLADGRTVLERAMRSVGLALQTPAGYQAAQIIGALQRGKFSARG
jgi:hypothetical protein